MNNELEQVVFSGIVAVRDRLLQLPDPLRLESGEPSFDTPAHIKEAAAKALQDNATHYAPSTGIKELKGAILEKVERKNGIDYLDGPDKVVVTNGGMHGMYCTFRTILNPGDEVIIPRPNWTATAWMIRLSGGKLKFCRLLPERQYRWDIEELEEQVTSQTRAALINSPHNPTGGVMLKEDLEQLLRLAEEHDLYVVSDEAYEDIIYDHEHVSIAAVAKDFPQRVRDKIISCYTFSKSYAMTGWRLGYTVCSSAAFAEQIKKMILYTINGVSTPTQYAGVAALRGPQEAVSNMTSTYRERRDILFDGVKNSPFLTCDTPPSGAFYLYARINDSWQGTAWDMVNHLIDNYSMGSVPGDIFYDTDKAIRFSYACSTDMIRRAVANLQKTKGATTV